MLAFLKRSMKIFTLAVFFFIIITSFLLNSIDNPKAFMWNSGQIVSQFSNQFENLIRYFQRPCSCSMCVSEEGLSPWFDERFNQTMQPFLTTQNAFVSEETYNWWQNLQKQKTEKRINESIQELFEIIPGYKHQPLERKTTRSWCPWCKRCRRCAVVGNSHNLRHSYYGAEIDNHDFVFRMNKAPIVGFESDVGNKTTHRFIYPESYTGEAENGSLVVIPFKTLDLLWVISGFTTGAINWTYVEVPTRIKVNKDKILIYHPHFMKYVHDTWLQHQGLYPSTGFLAMILALHVCDEVDLYGFGADSKGNWYHYWETNSSAWDDRRPDNHNGDFESNMMLTLASVNKIHVFMGR
ncbi:hypothetical protein lerEdw1_010733 [Lerista edwardsae]|nr:hypothetical protein lerEdw1_010733 [Lerista edwardsae]